MSFSLSTFIQANDIRPGDVIVLNKRGFGILDHYAAYIGNGNFVANLAPGIREISAYEIAQYLDTYQPVRVKRYPGSEMGRRVAVARAIELLNSGEHDETYHLVLNNCEHFTNYVQHGQRYSRQTKVAGLTAAGAGVAMLASKNENVQLLGIFSLLLGVGTLVIDAVENENNHGRPALPPATVPKRLR